MKVYPLRIAPILTIFTQNESSWRDLSFETHFVFRWFFSRRAVDGCSVDGRRMIFGQPFSHDKIRWISKIQISNFKFQISNFNWPGLGRDGSDGRDGTVGLQPWPSNHCPTIARHQNLRKSKCVPNDRSRHEDQFCPKIVKIGAILEGQTPVQSF